MQQEDGITRRELLQGMMGVALTKMVPASAVAEVAESAAPPPIEPVSSLTAPSPDGQILPMSIKERNRLGAVPKRGMCSTVPARDAANALVSGNGKMWVDVFGHPFSEQVVFHQERILQPWKAAPLEAPEIASVLPEVRKLILRGEYNKALNLSLTAAENTPTKPRTDNLHPHPAFDMRIVLGEPHAVHDYLRTTDFESGEVKVTWADKDGEWTRRTFVSRPDNVVVQLLTAPGHSTIEGTIQFDTSELLKRPAITTPHVVGWPPQGPPASIPQPVTDPHVVGWPFESEAVHEPGADQIRFDRSFDGHNFILEGRYVVETGNPGYLSVTKVIPRGGSVSMANGDLAVHGVSSLLLITRIQVYPDLEQSDIEPLTKAVDELPSHYQILLGRHRPGQSQVMDRVTVDFGGQAQHSMSGEELLADQRTSFGFSPALLGELFDMGRYWLYARTGDFPPMWGHININVNLQNSSAVMGDLPETLFAYTHWMEGLLPDCEKNAANVFGARGVLFGVHPTVEGNPLTHFAYTWPHHYWISGAGWMYSLMWDYYLATGDRAFLKQHVLPGLLQIGLFYEDYLKEIDKNGNYIFVPSYSPENCPPNSEIAPAVINATMDISVSRQVFTQLIEASETLHLHAEDVPRWKNILAKFPPYLTGPDGALKEWAWPSIEEHLDHRHVSHLIGAWPGDEFTPDATPELARAALLAARKRAQGNASAHGLLHRSLAAARLKDPYLVNFDLKQILEQGYINPSLTTRHNPYSFSSPDPQGGLPTLIMEMLVYSRPGVIGLLPAMPASLEKGSIKGVLCRTQAKIEELNWDLRRKEIDVTISSRIDQTVQIYVRRGIERVDAPMGVLTTPIHAGAERCSAHLSASHPVTLHILIGDEETSHWLREV